MYTSFEIRNFRCFRTLKVGPLARVNLIAGHNNVGKTALLEALFLHAGGYNPSLVITLSNLRGIQQFKLDFVRPDEPPWLSFFGKFDDARPISLIAEFADETRCAIRLSTVRDELELGKLSHFLPASGGEASGTASSRVLPVALRLDYENEVKVGPVYLLIGEKGFRNEPLPPLPKFHTRMLTARHGPNFKEQSELYGELEIEGKQDVVVEALRIIEPRLSRLTVIPRGDETMIHADVGLGRLVPVALIGDGVLRLLRIFLYIVHESGGLLLVDEVENGIHHSVMPKVWQAIGEAAERFNTQVIATTHSRECIIAAHSAFADLKGYPFRLHRLEDVHGEILDVTYDQETLRAAIEAGLEVR